MTKYDEFKYNDNPNGLYDDKRVVVVVVDDDDDDETFLKELKRYWKKFLFIIRYFTK